MRGPPRRARGRGRGRALRAARSAGGLLRVVPGTAARTARAEGGHPTPAGLDVGGGGGAPARGRDSSHAAAAVPGGPGYRGPRDTRRGGARAREVPGGVRGPGARAEGERARPAASDRARLAFAPEARIGVRLRTGRTRRECRPGAGGAGASGGAVGRSGAVRRGARRGGGGGPGRLGGDGRVRGLRSPQSGESVRSAAGPPSGPAMRLRRPSATSPCPLAGGRPRRRRREPWRRRP